MDISEGNGRKQRNLAIGGDGPTPTSQRPELDGLASTRGLRAAADTGAAIAFGDGQLGEDLARVQQSVEEARQTRARSQKLRLLAEELRPIAGERRLIAEHTRALAASLQRTASELRATSDRPTSRSMAPVPRPPQPSLVKTP